MSKIRAAITGVGGYVPEYKLTNKELEEMVDTNDEWIRTRTGIQERRILKGEGLGTSHMAIKAVEELFRTHTVNPAEIDVVICATVTPDRQFPDTANLIAHAVGATNAFSFDLSAACSGFLFALTTGAKFIEAGSHKKVLVIGGDKMSSIINYKDRSTCIIFGDGAGAVLLEATTKEVGFQDSILHSDARGIEHLYIKRGGSAYPHTPETIHLDEHFVTQNGRPVFKAAVSNMSNVVKEIIAKNELTVDDIAWLVPHQANIRIIESVSRMADFPMERVMVNIQKYGNTTAATIPLCLWEWEKQLKKGDNLILAAFGGGYTWGSIYLKWAYSKA